MVKCNLLCKNVLKLIRILFIKASRCKWRHSTVAFAELIGRDAEQNGRNNSYIILHAVP